MFGSRVKIDKDLLKKIRMYAKIAGYSSPDEFIVHGREIYLHTPRGVARSGLTNAYFDGRLGTTSTMRNWNTVLKILELLEMAGKQ